jgi:acetyltransferase-like isoleucine patch superfamily enzyme
MTPLINSLKTWFSGVSQLRNPALVRVLVALREEAEELESVRRHNPGAKIERGVILKCWQGGQLSVAKGATVCRGTVLSCNESTEGHGRIGIGTGTWIGQYNNFRTCRASDIAVGQNCLISQFCSLVASNHGAIPGQTIKDQPVDKRRLGVVLGDDVWLGAGVTVLPGVTIGSGAVIAANSVVDRDVPTNEIWAGSPAIRKGERSMDPR